ncbi:MAG: GGDEF domain-containing protein [Acidaminococcaceae bacterium]
MAENISDYLNSGALLSKLSDVTRIVDPLRKTVIEYKNNEIINNKIHCFDFWGKNKVCDNCISIRAYHENKTYVKIEYNNNKVFLITAIPHKLDERVIVIEILKDITDSMFLSSYGNASVETSAIHALIDNMNKFAYKDPLTEIYNRLYIIEKLPVDLMNVALLSNEMSIIMADIDHFKLVNDNYGHLAGDQALKKVAETLAGSIKRENDWVARYGGEEFLVCLPGAHLDFAVQTAEAMRKAIEKTPIIYEDKTLNLTASFGVCNIKGTETNSVEDLLKAADEKLYLAKKNGRNRVEW